MNRSARFVTIVPMIAIAAIIGIYARPPWTGPRIAGLVVTVIFCVLLTVARIELGNAFSLTPQARFLVTRGIYARVRHPVYVFSALALTGLFLYIDIPRLLLSLVIIIPMQIIRARREERVLEEKFGEAYREYRKSTWF